MCLIFSGKILKDQDTLTQHGIKDGVTVHLVIKTKPAESSSSAAPTTPANTTTTTTANTGSSAPQQPSTGTQRTPPANNLFNLPFGGSNFLNNLDSFGLGSSNFANVQAQMQQQVMNNPEFMRQMLDNPMIQSLMSNPDVIRELMMSNPQMQGLIERNPEIQHMLNNPSLMRETMELARNPAALQELMRHHDRALSNLESVPGGFNALQRIYRELEEPMLNAARDQFTPNPFSALLNNTTPENRQAGTENTQPLPNPWGPRQQGSSTAPPSANTTTTSSSSTTAPNPNLQNMNNIFSQLMGNLGGGATTTPSSNTTTTTPTTGTGSANTGAGGLAGGLFNSNMVQDYMQQMMSNPRQMESMLNAPYMQSLLQSVASNPEMTRMIVENNPQLAANPELREQIVRSMPQMLQQVNFFCLFVEF